MKRLERLLVPMIMVGILVLSGCDPAPGTAAYNSMLRRPSAAQVTGGSAPALISAPTLGSSFQGEKIPVDKALVYIYRPTGPMFGADVKIPFDVKANGKAVTTLVQGGYYAYVTEPGNIEFTAFDTGFMAPKSIFSITLDAKADKHIILKAHMERGLAEGRIWNRSPQK